MSRRGKRERLAAALKRERLRLAAEVESASLNHTDVESFDRDQRLGARLVLGDGTVLTERVKPPRRHTSYAMRPIWPVRPGSAGQWQEVPRLTPLRDGLIPGWR
jgi:hypothetical protein